jgi:hypothetical protein
VVILPQYKKMIGLGLQPAGKPQAQRLMLRLPVGVTVEGLLQQGVSLMFVGPNGLSSSHLSTDPLYFVDF